MTGQTEGVGVERNSLVVFVPSSTIPETHTARERERRSGGGQSYTLLNMVLH